MKSIQFFWTVNRITIDSKSFKIQHRTKESNLLPTSHLGKILHSWYYSCIYSSHVCDQFLESSVCLGTVSARGDVCQGGVCLGGDCPGGVSQHAMEQIPPPLWTEFLTHACENITFPQTTVADGNKMYKGLNTFARLIQHYETY